MPKPICRRRTFRGYGPKARIVNVALAAVLFLGTALGHVSTASGEPVRLLAFGDSLTAGYGLPQGDGFVPRLEAALRKEGLDVRVINAGVSGDTTAGGLARLDWVLASVNGGADAAIVELGANDGLRGFDPRTTEANLDAILSRLRNRDIAVLLAGMWAPPNLGREYADAFNALYPRLAEKHGVALYPFFLDGVAAQADLNQGDGIHPNADGVAVIVRRILPTVKDLVESVR